MLCVGIICGTNEVSAQQQYIEKVQRKSDWMHYATIAGFSPWVGMSDEDINKALDVFKREHVTVIEADSSLSYYQSDADFAKELALMRQFVNLAHKRGFKVLWYYPALEIITRNNAKSTLSEDHPDWVARGIDDQLSIHYGQDNDSVFWVDTGEESAWLSPITPYRDYFISRAVKIAETGIDGLWIDVPSYSDDAGYWTSHQPIDHRAFKTDTQLGAPKFADSKLPTWWPWVQWRYTTIDQLLIDVWKKTRAINSDFNIISEISTGDHMLAYQYGLDGSRIASLAGFWQIWEISPLSNETSMRYATADDWISLIAMLKFAKQNNTSKPTWCFSYGTDTDDARLMMGQIIAMGCNPYELKTPSMMTTVDSQFRQTMFSWILANQKLLFSSQSLAKIAVIHSSLSRDWLDGPCLVEGKCGTSMYSSWQAPNKQMNWWSDYHADSSIAANYMADYRGIVKALVHLHQPFNILSINQASLENLKKYELLIMPSPTILTNAQAQMIIQYVKAGGNILLTGNNPGMVNEQGKYLNSSTLAPLIRINPRNKNCQLKIVNLGQVMYCSSQIGKRYLTMLDDSVLEIIEQIIKQFTVDSIQTNAPKTIQFERYQYQDKQLLHVLNFSGVNGKFEIMPKNFQVSLAMDNMTNISHVSGSNPTMSEPKSIEFEFKNQHLIFDVNIDDYMLYVIE